MIQEEKVLAKENLFSYLGARLNKINIASILPIASLIILIAAFGLGNSAFFSVGNLFNILRQCSILLIVAVGATFVILMGSIDLSFGAVVTLSGAVTAILIAQLGWGVWASILSGVLIGVICGLVNGVVFAYAKVPSFLVTLGTSFALDGVALIVLNGSPVQVDNNAFLVLARGTPIFGIPNISIWAFAIYAIAIFIAYRTRFGRYMFAIGGGELVAKMSGVAVNKFKVFSFMFAGLLAGFAGPLLASRVGAASPGMGDGLLLDGIAAVVMGGTALTGGMGGPQMTLLGVLIISVLGDGMDIMSINPYTQIVVKGVVVVLAVAMSLDRSKIKIAK